MTDRPTSRAHDSATKINDQNARMRELVAKSIEALKLPMPDTFLGRKTQEPFPKEDTD